MGRINRHPLITIDITGNCNLRCVHCYNSDFLPFELSRKDISNILRNTPADWKIYFLGGEPLVHKGILDILSESVEFGHPTSLSTNGTLIDRIGASRLIETGVKEFYLSLDGADKESNDRIRGNGSFNAAIDGLVALEKATTGDRGISLNVSVTACGMNVNSIIRLPELLDSLNIHIDKLGISPMSPIGRGARNPQLRIGEIEWLDLCETLCSEWRRHSKILFLCIANPELAIRYLEARYHVLLNECVTDCRVVRKTDACRVLADGRIVPCSGRLDLIERMEKEGSLTLLHISQFDNKKNMLPFENFISDMEPYLRLDDPICRECLYKEQCQVCPLEKKFEAAPRMSRKAVCKEVWERVSRQGLTLETADSDSLPPAVLNDQYNDVSVDPSVYTRQLRDGGVVVVCPRDHSFHELDQAGTLFWQSLLNKKGLTNACAKYLNCFSDKIQGIRRLRYLTQTLMEANALTGIA